MRSSFGVFSKVIFSFLFTLSFYPQTVKTIKASGGDFSSFQAAFTWLNSYPASGFLNGIIFAVDAGFTSTENCILTASGDATHPVQFKKSGSGNNPVISAAAGSGAIDAIVTLAGADYITFDGIDVRESASNTSAQNKAEAGYLIKNASPVNGAQNNTIRNCKISLDKTNLNKCYCIVSTSTANPAFYGGCVPTDQATGCNNNNHFYNVVCENATGGIFLQSNGATYYDSGTEIGTENSGISVIGGTNAGDIGNGASLDLAGIRLTNQADSKVFNVEIRNVSNSGNYRAGGIWLENCYGTNYVNNNIIHNVTNLTSTVSSLWYQAFGIRTDVQYAANVNVYNNIIYNIANSQSTASSSTFVSVAGIIAGVTAGTANCYFNTIFINALPSSSSACILNIGMNPNTMEIRNNILCNTTSGQSGISKHYCIYKANSGNTITLNPCDNNDFYISNPGNGFYGTSGGTEYSSFVNWQGKLYATNDANSVSGTPTFISDTDFHINGTNSGNAILNHTGMVLPGYTTDIDGNSSSRSISPDIGADEFDLQSTVNTSSSIVGGSYDNLTINGSGITATLAGNVVIYGTLSMTVGSLALGGKTLTYSGTNSTLAYNGSSTQTTTDNELPATNGPSNLVISNANGVTLHASRSLSGTLSLMNGILSTGTNTIHITNSDPGAVTRTSGWINGPLKRAHPASTGSFLFPMGTAASYRGAIVNFTSAPSTTTNLTASFTGMDPGSHGFPTGITDYWNGGYWSITSDGVPGGTYSLSLDVSGISGISAGARILKRTTSTDAWSMAGTFSDFTSPLITHTGITGFSEFTIGGLSSPLPVELSAFTATALENSVELEWQTETEVNSALFQVERAGSSAKPVWEKIAEITAAVYSNSVKKYYWVDNKLAVGRYNYRLKMVDHDGTYKYSDVITATVSAPEDFLLCQNFPNPFNPATSISYRLPVESKVTLKIYNIVGCEIETLVNAEQSAGFYTVSFSGLNLPSGVYVYCLTAKAGDNAVLFSAVRKMLLIK